MRFHVEYDDTGGTFSCGWRVTAPRDFSGQVVSADEVEEIEDALSKEKARVKELEKDLFDKVMAAKKSGYEDGKKENTKGGE